MFLVAQEKSWLKNPITKLLRKRRARPIQRRLIEKKSPRKIM
jgi:hypothetical protein